MGTADKDYFLDEYRQLTTDEAKAAFVLLRKGQNIPKEMADKYGIRKEKEKSEPKAKAVHENKSVKPKSDKADKPEETE